MQGSPACGACGFTSADLPDLEQEFYIVILEHIHFHREMLFLSRDSFQELQAELWELSKALLDARRRGAWYRNTSQCFQYGRPCAYWPICSSGGNPMIIENQYQRIAPHEELLTASSDSTPVF